MLFGGASSSRFEIGCIGLHLAQAKSNLASLSHLGYIRDASRKFGNDPYLTSHRSSINVAWDEKLNSQGQHPPQPHPGEEEKRGQCYEACQEDNLGLMIASIAEGLHSELHAFLSEFNARLTAQQAALSSSSDRAAVASILASAS
jgi:hypothetical protein